MTTKHLFAIVVLASLVCAQTSAAEPACVLPVADGGGVVPSPASAQGEIVKITEGLVTLNGSEAEQFRFGNQTQLFTVYGGHVDASQLKTGQHVFVWFVGCKEEKGAPPMAAVIQLCSTAAETCLK